MYELPVCDELLEVSRQWVAWSSSTRRNPVWRWALERFLAPVGVSGLQLCWDPWFPPGPDAGAPVLFGARWNPDHVSPDCPDFEILEPAVSGKHLLTYSISDHCDLRLTFQNTQASEFFTGELRELINNRLPQNAIKARYHECHNFMAHAFYRSLGMTVDSSGSVPEILAAAAAMRTKPEETCAALYNELTSHGANRLTQHPVLREFPEA